MCRSCGHFHFQLKRAKKLIFARQLIVWPTHITLMSELIAPRRLWFKRNSGPIRRDVPPYRFTDFVRPHRAEGQAGRIGARLIAIVAEGEAPSRFTLAQTGFTNPSPHRQGQTITQTLTSETSLGFRVQRYGIDKHHKLYTARQLVAMTTLSDLVIEARERLLKDELSVAFPSDNRSLANGGSGHVAYSDAVTIYLALCTKQGV